MVKENPTITTPVKIRLLALLSIPSEQLTLLSLVCNYILSYNVIIIFVCCCILFCNFVLSGQTRQNHQSNLQVCVQGAREGSGFRLLHATFPNSQRPPSLLNCVSTSRGICTQSAKILQRQAATVSQKYSASLRILF